MKLFGASVDRYIEIREDDLYENRADTWYTEVMNKRESEGG